MGDFGAIQHGQWLPYFPPAAAEDIAHEVTFSSFSLENVPDPFSAFSGSPHAAGASCYP